MILQVIPKTSKGGQCILIGLVPRSCVNGIHNEQPAAESFAAMQTTAQFSIVCDTVATVGHLAFSVSFDFSYAARSTSHSVHSAIDHPVYPNHRLCHRSIFLAIPPAGTHPTFDQPTSLHVA